MRIVAIADLHGHLPDNLPSCDLLLIGGDLCPIEDHSWAYQKDWLANTFTPWLQKQEAKDTVYVAGNHDFVFEARGVLPTMLPHYLNNSSVEVQGLKVWGSPWSSQFGSWAFMEIDSELEKIWATIPDDTDIVLVHGPPAHCGAGIVTCGDETGSPSLSNRLCQIQPKLVVCGHIHEGYGHYKLGDARTPIINASIRNELYDIVNPPVIFDWA